MYIYLNAGEQTMSLCTFIRTAGMQVLAESLGPVGFARFIQQFEIGYGDYTKEKNS